MRAVLLVCLMGLLTACSGHAEHDIVTADHPFAQYSLAIGWSASLAVEGKADQRAQRAPFYLASLRSSLPVEVARSGETEAVWREQGCGFYGAADDGDVEVSGPLRQRLKAAMPDASEEAITAAYRQRAACLGLKPQAYFDTAAYLYDHFISSDVAKVFTTKKAGAKVSRDQIMAQLLGALSGVPAHAVHLSCLVGGDQKKAYLTAIHFGVDAAGVDSFPAGGSLEVEDPPAHPCPATFYL